MFGQINFDQFLGKSVMLALSHQSDIGADQELRAHANEFRNYFLPNGMIRVGHMMLLRNQIIRLGLKGSHGRFLQVIEQGLLDAITSDQMVASLPRMVASHPFGPELHGRFGSPFPPYQPSWGGAGPFSDGFRPANMHPMFGMYRDRDPRFSPNGGFFPEVGVDKLSSDAFQNWLLNIGPMPMLSIAKGTRIESVLSILSSMLKEADERESCVFSNIQRTLLDLIGRGVISHKTEIIAVRDCVVAYYNVTARGPEYIFRDALEKFHFDVAMNLDRAINFISGSFSNRASEVNFDKINFVGSMNGEVSEMYNEWLECINQKPLFAVDVGITVEGMLAQAKRFSISTLKQKTVIDGVHDALKAFVDLGALRLPSPLVEVRQRLIDCYGDNPTFDNPTLTFYFLVCTNLEQVIEFVTMDNGKKETAENVRGWTPESWIETAKKFDKYSFLKGTPVHSIVSHINDRLPLASPERASMLVEIRDAFTWYVFHDLLSEVMDICDVKHLIAPHVTKTHEEEHRKFILMNLDLIYNFSDDVPDQIKAAIEKVDLNLEPVKRTMD